jgi:beta-lactam-binding protein with PASTA domain
MVTRPRTVTAPPPYRPPGTYYEESPGRRAVWPWLLGLLAIAIAAGAGYLLYQKIQDQLNKGGNVGVIDVRSEVKNLAVSNLKNLGFEVKVEHESSDTIPVGEVVHQDPGPGVRIGKGSTVTIFVSTGKPKVQVPDVRGKTLSDAISSLNDVHLDADPHDVFNPAPPQTVVGQNPAGGTQVFTNTKVRLNVSRGPNLISIPNVVGSPFANAQSALKGAGFVVVRTDAPADQPKGEVVTTDPQVGTSDPKGTTVTVTVSKGPGTSQVPDVTGMQRDDAAKTLRAAGFAAVTIVMEPVTDPCQDGIVLAQDPPPNQKAKQGSTVTISVGQLVAPTMTETTTTETTTTATTTTAPTTTTPPTP